MRRVLRPPLRPVASPETPETLCVPGSTVDPATLLAARELRYTRGWIQRPPNRGVPMPEDRITVDPDQMGGVPCIRGLRIPVATVVAMIADGMTNEEILANFPDLVLEDIREALRFAARAVQERELPRTGT